MTNILPMLLNSASFDQTGLLFCQLFFWLSFKVSSVNRISTHAFAAIKISILPNQLIETVKFHLLLGFLYWSRDLLLDSMKALGILLLGTAMPH